MRCSECSAPVRPVVAVDIDGTLGDYHGHFLRFASGYLDSHLWLGYHGKPTFKVWFLDTYGSDERTWRDIKLAYRQGALKRTMPPYPHAAGLCQSVIDSGAELWLTTTRPFQRLDNIDPDTREWLRRQGIAYHGLLYDEDKYRVLAEIVDRDRVVAVLDDLPEQFDAATLAFGWRVPILARNPYNDSIRCEQEATDLVRARHLVIDRINDWKEQHEGDRTRSTA